MANPRPSDPPVTETATRARAGSTPGVTRNVLVIGLSLVVVLFTVIVVIGLS